MSKNANEGDTMCEALASEAPPTSRSVSPAGTFQCPTCRAVWRSAATCPRCGTDLSALMQVAMQAWSLRQAAQTALCEGNRPAEALALAQEACRLHRTPHGQRLMALALLLRGEPAAVTALLSQWRPEA